MGPGRAVARHRHDVTVRADGLVTVPGAVLRDPRVRAAALVDVGRGTVLDGWDDRGARHPEPVAGGAAEPVRVAVGLRASAEPEVLVAVGGAWRRVVRAVPDHGGAPPALSVLVEGPRSVVEPTRRRPLRIPVAALGAGPGGSRRPVDGARILPAGPTAALPRPVRSPVRATSGTWPAPSGPAGAARRPAPTAARSVTSGAGSALAGPPPVGAAVTPPAGRSVVAPAPRETLP